MNRLELYPGGLDLRAGPAMGGEVARKVCFIKRLIKSLACFINNFKMNKS